jgi:hypothetical protein
VANALADPVLELPNSTDAIVASNDDGKRRRKRRSPRPAAPTEPNESAIYATLPAGNYTGVVRGVGETIGIGLVEVYSAAQ